MLGSDVMEFGIIFMNPYIMLCFQNSRLQHKVFMSIFVSILAKPMYIIVWKCHHYINQKQQHLIICLVLDLNVNLVQ